MAEEHTLSPAPVPRGNAVEALSQPREGWLIRLARRLVLARLARIAEGRLEVIEGAARYGFGAARPAFPIAAQLRVHDPACWERMAWGGTIGAGEAYCEGLWSADDLTAVVRLLARNRAALQGVDAGTARLAEPVRRLVHRLRRNTHAGSRRNIAAHYDTGNEFFARFLDPSLTYSCALFDGEDDSLEAAQRRKLDTICRKLELQPGDRLVEIGTGWGALAVHAARHYGCEVVTTTISAQQFTYASRLIADAGLGDRVTVLQEDYRALPARYPDGFDKLVSVEMIEAVGHGYLPRFMQTVSRLLRPDGLALLQAILIPDQRYEEYRRSVDFIQQHIFPGSVLPSLARIQACAAAGTDLRLDDLEDLTLDYARTLREWYARFDANADAIAALGVSERERRKWKFYFAYCEGGFFERTVADVQLLYAKPGSRHGAPARTGRSVA